MRLAPGLVLLGLAALVLAAAAPAPVAPPFTVRISAPAAGIAIVSDRAILGRGDNANFTVWLNVTGNGQFQTTWVNVSFDTQADPSQNSLSQSTSPWTQPGACTLLAATSWFLQWQCPGLRAGSYEWQIPAVVPTNATVGHEQRVDADTFSIVGSGNVSAAASVTVWVAGAVLRIADIDSAPTSAVRGGQIVNFWINVTNEAATNASVEYEGTAKEVNLTVELDPGLQPGQGLANLTTNQTLAPDAVLSVNFEAIVARDLVPGTSLSIRVLVTYQDFNNHSLGPIEGESSPLYVVRDSVLSTPNLLAGAAIGLAAILTTLVVLLYAGQRKIVIDEVFFMTKGGLLIRHVSRRPELKKDDDLVASMFVAIQEFVRDSFRREASLDSVAFGSRHAAVVRGELTILAAVISHGDAEDVAPELLAAIRSLEARYWDVLLSWNGSLEGLRGVDEALHALMTGKFRSAWRVQIA